MSFEHLCNSGNNKNIKCVNSNFDTVYNLSGINIVGTNNNNSNGSDNTDNNNIVNVDNNNSSDNTVFNNNLENVSNLNINNVSLTHSSVHNLSGVTIPPNLLKTLNLGLAFIPTPKYLMLNKIKQQHEQFLRRIKLNDYFSNKPPFEQKYSSTLIPSSHKLNYQSVWTPPVSDLSNECKQIIKRLDNDLENSLKVQKIINDKNDINKIINFSTPNSNMEEIIDLKRFLNSNHIICKKSDKSKSIVLLKEESYVQEVFRQLNDKKYYTPLVNPLFHDTSIMIRKLVDKLFVQKLISEKQKKFLTPPEFPRPRLFYLLPKTHKPPSSWPTNDMPPGRPIISNCGSETNHIAKYIDFFLEQISNKHPSFIKNSFEFKQKICSKIIPPNALLVTADITSLYTNMKINLTLDAVRKQFNKFPDPNRPDRIILQLLNIILNRNDFQFNDKTFLQTCGTAMGLSSAPHLANIFLIEFDDLAMNYPIRKPLFYFRYLDDIFFIFDGSVDELKTFENYLNSLIPGISLSFNFNPTSVDFLDVTIFKQINLNNLTELKTKIFFKPTDTHQLLNFNSYHPPHTFKSIIKSQIIRFQRLSSLQKDFETTCKILFASIKHYGYSYHFFSKIKRQIKFQSDNNKILNNTNNKLLPIIIDYSPFASNLTKKYKNTLKQFPLTQSLRPIISFTNHPQLGKFIVSTKFNSTFPNPTIGSFRGCGNSKCNTCKIHSHDTCTFKSTSNNKQFTILDNMSCNSSNLIYLITCRKCHIQYVGETGRALRDRLTDHRSAIKLKKKTPIGYHFNNNLHSVLDLCITPIELIKNDVGNDTFRKHKENFWQNKLGTKFPRGLNGMPV